jgi:hypothetical protein
MACQLDDDHHNRNDNRNRNRDRYHQRNHNRTSFTMRYQAVLFAT